MEVNRPLHRGQGRCLILSRHLPQKWCPQQVLRCGSVRMPKHTGHSTSRSEGGVSTKTRSPAATSERIDTFSPVTSITSSLEFLGFENSRWTLRNPPLAFLHFGVSERAFKYTTIEVRGSLLINHLSIHYVNIHHMNIPPAKTIWFSKKICIPLLAYQ